MTKFPSNLFVGRTIPPDLERAVITIHSPIWYFLLGLLVRLVVAWVGRTGEEGLHSVLFVGPHQFPPQMLLSSSLVNITHRSP